MTEAERRLEETLNRLAQLRESRRVMSIKVGAVAALGAGAVIAMVDPSLAPPPSTLSPFGLYLVYIPVAISRAMGGKLAAWITAAPIFAGWIWLVHFDLGWMLAAGVGLICVAGFKLRGWPKLTFPRQAVPVPKREAKRVDGLVDRGLVATLLD